VRIHGGRSFIFFILFSLFFTWGPMGGRACVIDLTVNPASPETLQEAYSLNLIITATDTDPAHIITLSAFNLPSFSSGWDNRSGTSPVEDTLHLNPGLCDANPDYWFQFVAECSAGSTDAELYDLTVTNKNSPPSLITPWEKVTLEHELLNYNVFATDNDTVCGEPDASIEAWDVPSGASFVDSANGVGSFIWEDPTPEGVYWVHYRAWDGIDADTQMTKIVVAGDSIDLFMLDCGRGGVGGEMRMVSVFLKNNIDTVGGLTLKLYMDTPDLASFSQISYHDTLFEGWTISDTIFAPDSNSLSVILVCGDTGSIADPLYPTPEPKFLFDVYGEIADSVRDPQTGWYVPLSDTFFTIFIPEGSGRLTNLSGSEEWHPPGMECVFEVFRPSFVRGDFDGDGNNKEMSDYLGALAWAFVQPGHVAPECQDAVDLDDDGNPKEMSEQLASLAWAFNIPGGVQPADPGDQWVCGEDTTSDNLSCSWSSYCMGSSKGQAKIQASSGNVQGSANRLIVGEAGVSQDGYVTVPVFLTNDQALSGFEYTVTYDTELLTLEYVDNKGLTTEGYDFFVSDIDDQAGKVRVGNIPSFRFEKQVGVDERQQVANIVFKLDVERLSQDVALGLENVYLLDAGVHSLSAEWVSGVVKAGDTNLPKEFALAQNYPNPFNSTTLIRYALPAVSGQQSADGGRWTAVSLEVFNILGQKVATLVDGEQAPGYKAVSWNVQDLASGVYFYKLTAGGFISIKKMVLLR